MLQRRSQAAKLRRVRVFPLVLLFALSSARAGNLFLDEGQRLSLNWGFDPYYTFAGLTMSLLQPIVGENVLDAGAEPNIYWTLLRGFYLPRTMNLEVSVNPLPVTGVLLKTHARSFYDSAEITDGLNVIQSMTDGFPEPWAVSLFLGTNVFLVNFDNDETEGIGFGGFLFSYGNLHIVNNKLVDDHWLEVEAKLKGVSLSEQNKLSFSIRAGTRLHAHEEAADTLYLSLQRSHTNRAYTGWSLVQNVDIETRFDVRIQDFKPTRLILLAGKRFPLGDDGDYIFTMALGALAVFKSAYSGALEADAHVQPLTFLIRPMLSF
jgi:hypothetical protein